MRNHSGELKSSRSSSHSRPHIILRLSVASVSRRGLTVSSNTSKYRTGAPRRRSSQLAPCPQSASQSAPASCACSASWSSRPCTASTRRSSRGPGRDRRAAPPLSPLPSRRHRFTVSPSYRQPLVSRLRIVCPRIRAALAHGRPPLPLR